MRFYLNIRQHFWLVFLGVMFLLTIVLLCFCLQIFCFVMFLFIMVLLAPLIFCWPSFVMLFSFRRFWLLIPFGFLGLGRTNVAADSGSRSLSLAPSLAAELWVRLPCGSNQYIENNWFSKTNGRK